MAIRIPGTSRTGGQGHAPVIKLFEQRAAASYLPEERGRRDAPTRPTAPTAPAVPGGSAVPAATAASAPTTTSELAEQLDELDRCLERMDAVMAMLEADLERREATMRALFEQTRPVGVAPADPAAAAPAANPAPQRPNRARARRRRSRRARRRRQG